jgi:hypothetical protein
MTEENKTELNLTAEQRELMEHLVKEGMRLERERVLKIIEAMPDSEDMSKLGELVRGKQA